MYHFHAAMQRVWPQEANIIPGKCMKHQHLILNYTLSRTLFWERSYQKIIWDSRVRLTKSSTFHSLDAKQLIAECDHTEKVYYTSTHGRFNIQLHMSTSTFNTCVNYIQTYSATELTISHSLVLSALGGAMIFFEACPSSTALTRWANVREQTVSATFFSTGATCTTIKVLESPPT